MRLDKSITVFDDDILYNAPTDPVEFIKYFEDKIAMVPDEFKDSAKIELEGDCYYDTAYCTVSVKYTRPETDEEYASRKLREKQNHNMQEERELCELERLKKKFNV